ncbi:MAG: aliphatic sulfonate transporter, nucleotide binding/ATPase protein [Pseudomonadota bacterium]|jgi:sulfonate transport system ATP-binding protein
MSELVSRARGAFVSLRGLGKSFGERVVLEQLDLRIGAGEFIGVVGASGSGKSTLLRILAGLELPSAGEVSIAGEPASAARGVVRVVFQEPRLLPWRSVLQNVCIGAGPEQAQRGREVLREVGLGDRLADYPGVLSGGQRQRVALARALVHQPDVLLLDEPFAALDALTRLSAQQLVASLWAQHRFTAVLVTHDVSEAVRLCDRVLVLDGGRIRRSVDVSLPHPRARHWPELAQLERLLLHTIGGDALAPEPWPEEEVAPRERPARVAARRSAAG